MPLSYAIYDVFTQNRLEGNPLAVVFGADALDDQAMQTIAQEFNLSETVFIRRPGGAAHTARLRIFTPGRELALCRASDRRCCGGDRRKSPRHG